MAGERTEKATPKRVRRAREQGQVSRSADLTGSSVLAVGLLVIGIRADGIAAWARELSQRALAFTSGSDFDSSVAVASLGEASVAAAAELAPVLLAMLLGAILVSFVQVGPIFTLEPLRPRLDRVDPLTGSWKRYLSASALFALARAAAKIVVVAAVAFAVIFSELATLLSISRADTGGAASVIVRVVSRIAIWTMSALLLLGLLDLFHQRAQLAKRLRMSKEERRAEGRESQGNARAKAARRRLGAAVQADLVAGGVARAHFVVTEPSGATCAFRWVPGEGTAPRLVAKGIGSLATRITEAARRRGLPIVVDAALSRGGYQQEVGEVIGEDLFGAAWAVIETLGPMPLSGSLASPGAAPRGVGT